MPKPINPIKRINLLYGDCLDLLEQEVKHLKALAIVEKLSRDPAKDLRDIVKLLAEMREAQERIIDEKKAQAEAKAKALSNEQLKGLVK